MNDTVHWTKNGSENSEHSAHLTAAASAMRFVTMFALSNDPHEIESLRQCGHSLGLNVNFAEDGPALTRLLARPVQESLAGDLSVKEGFLLVVLGGNLPAWVLTQLLDDLRSKAHFPLQTIATVPRGFQGTGYILLPAAGQLDGAVQAIDKSQVMADFLGKPLSSEEFVVRVSRLQNQLIRSKGEILAGTQFSPIENSALAFKSTTHIDTNVSDRLIGPAQIGIASIDLGAKPEILRVGKYGLLHRRKWVTIGSDTPIRLTYGEFEIAWSLFSAVDQVVSREHLESTLKSYGRSRDKSRLIDSYISRLRKKLAINESNGVELKTVYGHGYVLSRVQI